MQKLIFICIYQKYSCNEHLPDSVSKESREKDQAIQVYLRRYAINHNKIVNLEKGFESFEEIY